MKNANGIANNEMTAPYMNAAWMPVAVAAMSPAPAASWLAAVEDITVMNSAVPAAPASCWAVPTTALPCEYSVGLSEARPAVNRGVNRNARSEERRVGKECPV